MSNHKDRPLWQGRGRFLGWADEDAFPLMGNVPNFGISDEAEPPAESERDAVVTCTLDLPRLSAFIKEHGPVDIAGGAKDEGE